VISKKKLQVFVSSTYTDLRDERQAAVEAILTSGHIPAGMELFAAGDQSQMEVIRHWIDESDVFLLILGGRYGTEEPTAAKSYIQLEYEYAESKKKPLFALVITEQHLNDKIRSHGITVIETENPQKLKMFRKTVLSKMCRFWSDPRDIKLAIQESLKDLSQRENLVGWISASHAAILDEQIGRLSEENESLRERISNTQNIRQTFSGLTFDQMYETLSTYIIDAPDYQHAAHQSKSANHSPLFGRAEPTLLDLLWVSQDLLLEGVSKFETIYRKLHGFGLVYVVPRQLSVRGPKDDAFVLTDTGVKFLFHLKARIKSQSE
jgi:hypothetical protein